MDELDSWKDIPGFEGKYQANENGLIKSLSRYVRCQHSNGMVSMRKIKEKILAPGTYCKSGHVSVVLGRGTQGIPVHQLIALTFMGKTPEGMEILHTNGNPKDNRLCNIRFGTRTDNILDVYRQGKRWRKLSVEDVYEIRRRLLDGETGRSIAKVFNVSEYSISCIKTGRCFSWLD